jgi:hypothetical protein
LFYPSPSIENLFHAYSLSPYCPGVHEKSEAEKIDTRSAAYSLAKDLRSCRQLGGLQKSLQQAHQQFATLNLLNVQKQQAILALMTLQGWGVSLDEIYRLTKMIDFGKLGTVGQGNGGNDGFNLKDFKLDDKLNCVV